MTIYAFEDEDSVRALYERVAVLAKVPFKTFEDPSHLKGLNLDEIASTFTDVAGVITDREMPGMSGTELIDLLRKAGYKKPIVLITGGLRAEELDGLREKYLRAYPGTDTVVKPKPVEIKDLREMMQRWLAQ